MNLEFLEKYYEEGWLIKQTHPTLPLTIWNYSQATQYEGKWDDVTLSCRGLITEDTTGKVIVRPFPKFFNYEEFPNDVPFESSEYVYVQDKMDGSLGILFNYNSEWIMATRGSFTSDQAIKGLEMLKSKYILDTFEPSVAFLCEIIYNENRIVVNYDFEGVKFLGAVPNMSWNNKNDDELHWTTAESTFRYSGIKKSDIVNCEQVFKPTEDLYKVLKEKNTPNNEGFVLRFHPSNKRVKIKFEEYIRLHRIMTEISTKSVWECLSRGDDMYKILEDVPDEFFDKIDEYVEELKSQYIMLEAEYKWIFNKLRIAYFKVYDRDFNRAEFAKLAKRYKYPQLLFKMLDGSDYTETLWRILKPEFRKL